MKTNKPLGISPPLKVSSDQFFFSQISFSNGIILAPQHSNSQTSSNSTERQQAADDLSDFFGTPVSASTPQQKASPLTQHGMRCLLYYIDDNFNES